MNSLVVLANIGFVGSLIVVGPLLALLQNQGMVLTTLLPLELFSGLAVGLDLLKAGIAAGVFLFHLGLLDLRLDSD